MIRAIGVMLPNGLMRPAAVVLLVLALGLAAGGCGAQSVGEGSAEQAPTTDTCRGSTTTLTTTRATITTTTSTTETFYPMTTSAVFSAHSQEAQATALELGEAVIAHFSDQCDLAAAQSLVAPSAREGLAHMLSSLVAPTGCKVTVAGGSQPYSVIEVGLLFADGRSPRLPEFKLTVVVDPDQTTIVEITCPISSLPEAYSMLVYLSPDYSYYTAETVVLGTVMEVLPLRRGLLAGTGDAEESDEHQPGVYNGYVLKVERAYGPKSVPERITVYALGTGAAVLDGVTQEAQEEHPLDASLGDRLLMPLMKAAHSGTPDLQPDEYWVQANWAVFAVDDLGRCMRATGSGIDPESRHEYPLSELEDIALEQGKQPSLID